MGSTNRIERMTPNDAWETYVGSQSTAEFVAGESPEGAAMQYVESAENCLGLNVAERSTLRHKLVQHIEANRAR